MMNRKARNRKATACKAIARKAIDIFILFHFSSFSWNGCHDNKSYKVSFAYMEKKKKGVPASHDHALRFFFIKRHQNNAAMSSSSHHGLAATNCTGSIGPTVTIGERSPVKRSTFPFIPILSHFHHFAWNGCHDNKACPASLDHGVGFKGLTTGFIQTCVSMFVQLLNFNDGFPTSG